MTELRNAPAATLADDSIFPVGEGEPGTGLKKATGAEMKAYLGGAAFPPFDGNAGKALLVNEDEDGTEWGEVASGGGGSNGPVYSEIVATIPIVNGEVNIDNLNLSDFDRIEIILDGLTPAAEAEIVLMQIRTNVGLREIGYSGYLQSRTINNAADTSTDGNGTSMPLFGGKNNSIWRNGALPMYGTINLAGLTAATHTYMWYDLVGQRQDSGPIWAIGGWKHDRAETVKGIRLYSNTGFGSGQVIIRGVRNHEASSGPGGETTYGGDLVTGWRRTSDGWLEQWGQFGGSQASSDSPVVFPVPFVEGVVDVHATTWVHSGSIGTGYSFSASNVTLEGFTPRPRYHQSNATANPGETFRWFARGK